MKKVTLVGKSFHGNVYEIESEPGDLTSYSYFVYRDGPDEFCFMPKDNTFKYPQRLCWWDVNGLQSEDEKLIELAETHNCNPFTLLECIGTMEELHG